MSKAEIIKHLKRWEKLWIDIESNHAALSQVLGCDPESKFMRAIYDLRAAYTDEIAQKVGDTLKDEHGYTWLTWYAYECDMGRKPREAKIAEWKRMRKINSIKKLAELIA